MEQAESRIIGDRWHNAGRLMTAAVVVAVVVRLAVAGFLIAGPATDEPAELAGWDAERFQEIVDRTEPAWRGQPVEYPPGSVVVLDRLAGDDVVATHRRLVALSVALDLATATLLWRRIGAGTGRAFLLLGLPLVPLGYQRLDTLVTAMAAVAGVALLAPEPGRRIGAWRGPGTSRGLETWRGLGAADGVAATAIAAGTLTKIWPLVLFAGAAAIGRWRVVVVAAGLTAAAGLAWLGLVGDGLAPVDQVLSLRGATGWHVESLPGALVALAGDADARLELDAFRIGTLHPGLVTAGRLLALVVMGLLVLAGLRRSRAGADRQRILAVTTLGATSVLLVTAPLLSPQFLVWTTPWAALLVADRGDRGDRSDRGVERGAHRLLALAAGAAVLTGFTLTVFGPSGLAATAPAALLSLRNLLLLAIAPLALMDLAATGQTEADQTLRNEERKAR